MKVAAKAMVALACVLLTGTLVVSAGAQRSRQRQYRNVTGHVYGNNDVPLEKAIVYIKNTKSLAMKTYITGADGSYRFNALAQNVDYELYAEYNGKRSGTRTLSSFDDRPDAYLNIHIDVGK